MSCPRLFLVNWGLRRICCRPSRDVEWLSGPAPPLRPEDVSRLNFLEPRLLSAIEARSQVAVCRALEQELGPHPNLGPVGNAIFYHQPELLRCLLQKGTDPNLDLQPLHCGYQRFLEIAKDHGDLECFRILLDFGADSEEKMGYILEGCPPGGDWNFVFPFALAILQYNGDATWWCDPVYNAARLQSLDIETRVRLIRLVTAAGYSIQDHGLGNDARLFYEDSDHFADDDWDKVPPHFASSI